MCDPVSIGLAAVGAATSIYGASQQAAATKAQSQAIADADAANQRAQQQAFTTRNQAAQQQTAAQLAASQQTLSDESQRAALTGQQQMAALRNYQTTLQAENTQADTLRNTGDAAAQQLLQQTNAPTLDAAQQQRTAQTAALLATNMPQGPQPGDPSGNDPVQNDPAAQAAGARRTAEAATNIRNYGGKIATLSGYDAPTQQVGLANLNTATGIMPAQLAAKLLAAGNATRLLPTQIAYGAATAEGNTGLSAIQSRGQNALDAAGLSYGNATDIANLTQSNADVLAKNKLDQATANAAYQKSQAGIISGLGNLALYGAGYSAGGGKIPGLSSLSSLFGGSAPNADYGPGTVNGPIV
jgi:hypothetical protein